MYFRDFSCTKCGAVVEKVFDSYGDFLTSQLKQRCEVEGCEDAPPMIPLCTLASFQLRGGGWARDGYG